jgi:glycosyltransferase involved in cell wall biosynthesis
MRILTIVHEFPPIGGGGGRAAYDICRQLVQRGHHVQVLTAHLRGLARHETVDGIELHRLPSLRRHAYRAYFSTMLAFVMAGVWAGLRLIRSDRPHVMHVHFAVPAGAVAWILSRLTGVRYILTAHLGDVPGGVPEKTDRWFNWILPLTPPIWRRAKRVVAVSEYTRQLSLKRYPVDISIIPNGADLESLKPGALKVNSPVRLVFAGRFMTQKSPLRVVQALQELIDLDWRCAMLGDGPLLQDVRREAQRTGLQERFDLPGWVSPAQVLDWFTRSDILFMPSLAEGLPVVGVHALATGLAMVVSRIGGFVDLVQDGRNGYLVDVQDNPGYVSALRRLISEPGRLLQFRQASLEMASAFDIRRVGAQYESLLQEVASGR